MMSLHSLTMSRDAEMAKEMIEWAIMGKIRERLRLLVARIVLRHPDLHGNDRRPHSIDHVGERRGPSCRLPDRGHGVDRPERSLDPRNGQRGERGGADQR